MSFLRFIKTNSLNKSFLKYGIVELILVVTGILIALQVNNYNEYLKDREEEKNILLAFHYETSNNLEILNRSIKEKRTIIQINKEILDNVGPKATWFSTSNLDSLMYYITVSGWIYVPNDGVLNEIINSGKLSLIKDQNLKNEISSIPRLSNLILSEDNLYRDDLHQYFLPFISKNYKLRNFTEYRELYKFSKSDLGKSKFKLFDNNLINNLEFENILTIQSIWIKFSVDMCENLKLNYKQIQKLIEIKYPDVDYSKLGENITINRFVRFALGEQSN